MKRILKIAALVILAVVVVVGGLVGYAFIGRQSITDGFEAGDIRIVKDSIVSVGVVPVGSGHVALIDAGNDKAGQAILKELSRRKLDKDAVVAIFITHGHADHTGAIGLFPKADVMVLAADAPLVEGTEHAHGPLTRLMPLSPAGKVTRALRDGEVVMVGDTEFRVYAVPGHTQGSGAYLVRGVLFMGDAADADSNGRLIGAPWIFSDSQSQDRESLLHLADRLRADKADVQTIAFAHSGVRTEGLMPLIAFAQDARN